MRPAVRELRRLGAAVETQHDGLVIAPSKLRRAEVATYQDRRMAMSLTIAGIAAEGVVIQNPGCVAKTFPTFFEVLETVRPRC